MTLQETGAVMDILQAAYPQFYAGKNAPDPRKTTALWASMFSGDDPRLVIAAVKALINVKTDSFPPTIGAVREQMDKLTRDYSEKSLDAAAAWVLVRKAVSRGIYNSEEEFGKLPEEVQAVVHAPEQLRNWAMMDAETVDSVIASNFQRAYRAREKTAREVAMLPESVRSYVAELAAGKRLEIDGGR